ncbi:hypothetical protein [Streptomyces sp. NPDC002187]
MLLGRDLPHRIPVAAAPLPGLPPTFVAAVPVPSTAAPADAPRDLSVLRV